ncbi:heparan-alpha-glucosaminide N-acetyltransferase [Acetanaerobacterium elongatum]|uniref:Uncharacterized membrane protein n=1 Tax=Acetanaerobacterium elongatum TaxID=258515 RepID=A0A1G9Z504_9FIRM|nr:heparan-alpha-glucosaminide N-acetyltransferase [Acetanaerobacterium elongatum]SDN16364.1 Uncharacterized membrane protein [Acetanaerobacterium elongatum]
MDEQKLERLKRRVGLIDELRGLSIVLMVVYHTFFDLVYIFGLNIPLFNSGILNFLQQFFAGVFIVISGVACRYARSNLKRGAMCFGIGMLLTVGTLIFMPSELILFGILHFLGIAMMLYGLLHKVLDKLAPLPGMLASAALFAATYRVMSGYLLWFRLPEAIYNIKILFPLGFPAPDFYSADYFPLLPWLFLFFAGAYLGVYFKENKMPAFCYKTHLRPLAFVGRHTLLIYVLHQPIVYGVLMLIFYLIRG